MVTVGAGVTTSRPLRPFWGLLASVALLLGATSCADGPRGWGPLPQGVYVWQLAWNDQVAEAVTATADIVDTPVVLATELTVRGCTLRPRHATYRAEVFADRPTGVAVRLGPLALERCGSAVQRQVIAEVVAARDRAHKAGLTIAEVQLDYDTPTRSLRSYAALLSDLRTALGEAQTLTITSLPTWLGSPAFADVAAAVDAFVLQVHALEGPRGPKAATLFDPVAARRAIDKAGELERPFHVALPTYGYELGFEAASDRFLGLKADATAAPWPAGTRRQVIRAAPSAVATLARELESDRPAHLTALRWFRLPVGRERLNWDRATFRAVVSRAPVTSRLRTVTTRMGRRLDVHLVNVGSAQAEVPAQVKAPADCSLMAEGIAPFEAPERRGKQWSFEDGQHALRRPLAPGERRRVGWLLMGEGCDDASR